jgi:hypothetical protein
MACYDLRKEVYFMGLIVSGCNLGNGAKELHQTAPCVILQLKCVGMYSFAYLEWYKHTNTMSHTPFILMNDLHTFCMFSSVLLDDGQCECSIFSTKALPFVKCENHSKVYFYLR